LVGRRQTSTFQALAPCRARGNTRTAEIKRHQRAETEKRKNGGSKQTPLVIQGNGNGQGQQNRDFGLTVRVEVNLPQRQTKKRTTRFSEAFGRIY